MASLLSTTATALFSQDPKFICFSPSNQRPTASQCSSTSSRFLRSLTDSRLKTDIPAAATTNSLKCNAISDTTTSLVPLENLDLEQSLSQFPGLQSGLSQLQSLTAELPQGQRWGILLFAGFAWLYLTARPGVLLGAIDSYLLAPLQLGFDTLTGRRRLKRTNFLIGERLGEGSFGVVYSGVIVPKNVTLDAERVSTRATRRALETDQRFKDKVILKKVISLHAICSLICLKRAMFLIRTCIYSLHLVLLP